MIKEADKDYIDYLKKETENNILNAVCEYLELKRYFFWRVNNIPVYNAKTETYRRMPKYSIKGVPDILLLSDGIIWGFEIKSLKGKQSSEQKEFEEKFKSNGGKYCVIRELEDLQKLGF